MKKIVLVVLAAALCMGIGVQNASADNSLKQGNFSLGVTTATDNLIFGKYMVTNDLAIGGGFGLNVLGGDAKGTDISLAAGVRKFIKVADFAPFFGGVLGYAVTNDSNNSTISISAEGGAEYFLAKHFSFEGAVQFGYKSTDQKAIANVQNKAKASAFGTNRAAIGFNFYF